MTQLDENPVESPKRFLSIDVFKGLAVLLMVFVNSIQNYNDIPSWTKHAGDYGLTYVDLVAPFFVFMLALNLNISYNRRVKKVGKKRALLRYLRRYLILIGIGLILMIYIDEHHFYLRWGTLQVLGVSGLMLLPLVNLKTYIKLIFAVVFMCIHQLLLFTPMQSVIYNSIEGGFFGLFSWGSMMVLSSVLGDGLKKGKEYVVRYFLYGGLICFIIGIALSFFQGISRPYISIPYILISVGIASMFYCFLYFLYEQWGTRFRFVINERIFSAIGRNAFIFFIIHLLIVYSIFTFFPPETPNFIIIPLAIGHAVFVWILAYLMSKYEIYIVI
ncbi:MAG: DUF1624 domain-containing protein [Candidatus Lokiarchaeota archaeon]|nr:DUF1624 domain-containing protein [Candidatus Lokiarchaeota archaeon]